MKWYDYFLVRFTIVLIVVAIGTVINQHKIMDRLDGIESNVECTRLNRIEADLHPFDPENWTAEDSANRVKTIYRHNEMYTTETITDSGYGGYCFIASYDPEPEPEPYAWIVTFDGRTKLIKKLLPMTDWETDNYLRDVGLGSWVDKQGIPYGVLIND